MMLLFLAFPVWADQQGGQRPAAYLLYGMGGAQDAMAGAAVANRGDVACGFWNPAGLNGLRGFQVETQSTLLSLGQQLHYLGLANSFRNRFFYGLSAIFYSAGGDLEARLGPSLNPDSVFEDVEMTFLTSFAFRLSSRWSFGGNLKILVHSLQNLSGFGIGEDLGVQYRFTKHTTFGFVAQDPYTVFTYSNTTSEVFPVTLKAGLAHHEETLNLKGNFDLEWSSDLGLRPRLGVEWRPVEVIALRGGCWMGGLSSGAAGSVLTANFTGGVGILVPMGESLLEFDYTLLPDRLIPGALLHQFSLAGKFL